MILTKRQGGIFIVLTFVIGFMLTMMPLPDWGDAIRPQWVVLVLIYWCIALPDRFGVVMAWFVGLLLDVGQGALLGQNALALAFVSFLAIKLHLRIRVFPLWQQAMSIFLLVAVYQMLILWIKGIVGASIHGWSYWLHSIFSMFVWPFVYVTLRAVRRYYRVR